MADGGPARGGGPAAPALLSRRIELVGLAHIMAECASGQQVPIDGELGKLFLERVGQGQRQSGHTPDVVGLGAPLQRGRVGIARGANLVDGLEGTLAQAVGPGVHHQIAEFFVLDLRQLGKRFSDRFAQVLTYFHGLTPSAVKLSPTPGGVKSGRPWWTPSFVLKGGAISSRLLPPLPQTHPGVGGRGDFQSPSSTPAHKLTPESAGGVISNRPLPPLPTNSPRCRRLETAAPVRREG